MTASLVGALALGEPIGAGLIVGIAAVLAGIGIAASGPAVARGAGRAGVTAPRARR